MVFSQGGGGGKLRNHHRFLSRLRARHFYHLFISSRLVTLLSEASVPSEEQNEETLSERREARANGLRFSFDFFSIVNRPIFFFLDAHLDLLLLSFSLSLTFFFLQVTPYKAHHIDPPTTTVTTTKAELLKYFETMFRMRRLEVAADMQYKSKQIRGFCHLYDGQEAVIVGLEAASTYNDSIITSYRDHCTHLGRGGTCHEVMAELMGKVTGATKGMGGS